MRRVAVALLAAAALVSGCGAGDDGPTYTAKSFVAAADAEDAGIELGEPLPFPREEVLEERTLRFQGTGAAPTAPGGDTPVDVHGSGTIAVFGDDADAVTEYGRCQAGGLICMRVANVAITFAGDVAPADLDRLADALRALGADS